jgi:glutamate--cysteine ligase catalytic subunit
MDRLPKSRYESISSYICNCKAGAHDTSATDKYNDIDCPVDEAAMATLLAAGVDKTLARHVAHLFVRDPLVIFSERIHLADSENTDHFENLQSTNWQTVRWKPPPPNSDIGWRVEFRSMEAQLTDFENAALTVITVLLSRVLLYFRLNLYVPLSKVDDNMVTAHKRDAVVAEKFWFRKHMADDEVQEDGDEYELMTISEILTGKGAHFPGLLPLVFAYLDSIGCDHATRATVRQYAMLLEKRASGEVQTAAKYVRDFVQSHHAYRQDSVVSHEIAHDLMVRCADIGEGRVEAPELLGDVVIDPIRADGAYEVPLEAEPLDLAQRKALIEKYAMRAEADKRHGKTVSDGWRSNSPVPPGARVVVEGGRRAGRAGPNASGDGLVRREWSRDGVGPGDPEVNVPLAHDDYVGHYNAGAESKEDADSDEAPSHKRGEHAPSPPGP